MRKRRDEDNESGNSESRELWLDETTLDEMSNTYDGEDADNPSNDDKTKE